MQSCNKFLPKNISRASDIGKACSVWKAIAGPRTTSCSLQFRQIVFQCEGHMRGNIRVMTEHLGSVLVSYVFLQGQQGRRKVSLWQCLSVFNFEVAYKSGNSFTNHHSTNISVELWTKLHFFSCAHRNYYIHLL